MTYEESCEIYLFFPKGGKKSTKVNCVVPVRDQAAEEPFGSESSGI